MSEKNCETKWHTVRESYLRMLIGKAMKYDILMDEDSKLILIAMIFMAKFIAV